ncbi:MAG TPA: invasion associated locus B family protein [Hyphomicrobiaceae bacterium]|nr:invasion associated locus B family protein [Hyphomicrobiaceae bacterium]
MTDTTRVTGWMSRGARAVTVAACALALTTGAALAQAKKDQKGKAPPAAAKKEAAKKDAEPPQSAWVKLCEKAPIVLRDKDGKPTREQRNICLTHHERLDGNTGMVLVSAALRQVEGEDKQHLMVMVPLGMAIGPGLRATVYNAEQWDKIQKNEKFDDTKLEPVKFHYTLCHPAGCTAEIEATKELIDSFRKGAGIMVLAINAQGQVVAFPVPLVGFKEALEGQPIDNQKYSEARKALMQQIAQRQQQLAEEARKRQAEAKDGKGEAAPAQKK